MSGKLTVCLALCLTMVSHAAAQAGYGYDSYGPGAYADYSGYAPQVVYYAGPTSYQGSESAYYSSPAPVVYYGYYAAAPAAPASSYGYYAPSQYYSGVNRYSTYHYTSQSPSAHYYVATAPSSYYYATASPAYYGGYAEPSYAGPYHSGYGYKPAAAAPAAPSTCPSCPICSLGSSSSSHAGVTKHESANRANPAGTCYCPFDSDWKVWAVADPRCRATLQRKCDVDSRLPCAWLDSYFSAVPSAAGFKRPHEQDISNFLYNDCPAAPPCSCSGLQFGQSDSPAQVYKCCSDLQLYTQLPFSGLSRSAVDAYCTSGQRANEISGWVQHSLWHATCPSHSQQPLYTFVLDSAAGAKAAAQPASSSQAIAVKPSLISSAAAALPAAPVSAPARQRSGLTNAVLVSALVGAAGGTLVAALALFLCSRRQHNEYASLA